jgi:hypothetical protein
MFGVFSISSNAALLLDANKVSWRPLGLRCQILDQPTIRAVPGGVAAVTASRDNPKAYFQPGISAEGMYRQKPLGSGERMELNKVML